MGTVFSSELPVERGRGRGGREGEGGREGGKDGEGEGEGEGGREREREGERAADQYSIHTYRIQCTCIFVRLTDVKKLILPTFNSFDANSTQI